MLQHDQFVKTARSQIKWYSLRTDKDKRSIPISFCYNETARLKSSYSRNNRYSGLASTPPASRAISQETLKKWHVSPVTSVIRPVNRCLNSSGPTIRRKIDSTSFYNFRCKKINSHVKNRLCIENEIQRLPYFPYFDRYLTFYFCNNSLHNLGTSCWLQLKLENSECF